MGTAFLGTWEYRGGADVSMGAVGVEDAVGKDGDFFVSAVVEQAQMER